ncbi:MAG: hypothetical protein GYA87_07620 [Christensenellaceae bacterium]|nr:hypothetical protein [Christensenellaceae bacterium]
MRILKDIPFREIRGGICYIPENDNIKKLPITDYMKGDEKANGIICYGYVDFNAGISFEVLCKAYKDPSGNITGYEGNKNKSIKLRLANVKDCQVVMLNDIEIYNAHSSKIDGINDYYKGTKAIEKLRSINYSFLDPFRHPEYPDDIQAALGTEYLWVRCKLVRDDIFYGTLLNDSIQNPDLRSGEEVMFKYENGKCEIVL